MLEKLINNLVMKVRKSLFLCKKRKRSCLSFITFMYSSCLNYTLNWIWGGIHQEMGNFRAVFSFPLTADLISSMTVKLNNTWAFWSQCANSLFIIIIIILQKHVSKFWALIFGTGLITQCLQCTILLQIQNSLILLPL